MRILFPQTPDPGSLTMPSPPPSFLAALSGRRKLQDGSPLGRGLDRNWQASDVGPSACLGPNTEEWATRDGCYPPHHLHAPAFACSRNELRLQHPLPAAIQGSGSLCLSPLSLCHLGVEPMERSGPPHFETKNCSFTPPEAPEERPCGWVPKK